MAASSIANLIANLNLRPSDVASQYGLNEASFKRFLKGHGQIEREKEACISVSLLHALQALDPSPPDPMFPMSYIRSFVPVNIARGGYYRNGKTKSTTSFGI